MLDPEPLLPNRAGEDADEGWGAEPEPDAEAAHDDWLRRQRPPHHS